MIFKYGGSEKSRWLMMEDVILLVNKAKITLRLIVEDSMKL